MKKRISITEEMYDLMMHMIGYGVHDGQKFMDAIKYEEADPKLAMKLAKQCDERWGMCMADELKELLEE